MKALASSPVILFIVFAVARYIVLLLPFSVYRLKTVSVWHVRNRSNRFVGGRLFTANNLPEVKCNLYHPYSRWCRKACRCLREVLTYRDQRSRCVKINTVVGQVTSNVHIQSFEDLYFSSSITVQMTL